MRQRSSEGKGGDWPPFLGSDGLEPVGDPATPGWDPAEAA